ncbi:MAG: ABC transporter substrate-binding protein [Bacteroidetes bacterium]|nr:ABC transporter substrate-binding protein [Bacteroidota bacterium]
MERRIFVDQMGRSIEVPNSPERIVSLVPSQTELLHYFGLENEVVGITKFCIHPDSWFKSKTRIGGTKQLKIDEIIDLKPDFIIGNKEENTKEDVDKLDQRGLPVWMSDINSFDEAIKMIEQVGLICGKESESLKLTSEITQRFNEISTIGKGRSVLYFIWDEPSFVVGKNTFINSMIEKIGFVNACDLIRYPNLNDLPNTNPDLIFLSSEPYPFTNQHIEKYQNLFPNSNIILVDGEMFSWYGSRMLEAVSYFKNLKN